MNRKSSVLLSRPRIAAPMVCGLSFLIGGLTAWAQTVLPYSLLSLANSANGWVLVVVVLLLSVRARPFLAMALGCAGCVLLMLGYTAGLALYGKAYDPLLWTLSAGAVGPFIGLATAWLRESGIRAALGTAALAAVTIGEAVYGLIFVSESTSPVYWTISGLAGLAFLIGMIAYRIRGVLPIAVAIGVTATVVLVFIPVYATVGTYA